MPHEHSRLPSESNLWTRQFPYPSETKMSPFGAVDPPWACCGLAGTLDHEPLVDDARIGRLPLRAQGQEKLLVAAELLDDVGVPVHQVHVAVPVHVGAVGLVELPAPHLDQVALPVQDHQLVIAAIEGVDIVLIIHCDPRHLVELVPVGQAPQSASRAYFRSPIV